MIALEHAFTVLGGLALGAALIWLAVWCAAYLLVLMGVKL